MTRRKSRPKRKPLGTRSRLDVPEKYREPGNVYRVVNNTPGRLDDFLEAGWDFVKKDRASEGIGLDSALSFHVGVDAAGQPMRAYAMYTSQEWYDEDQAAKQVVNDQVDEAIRGGVTNVQNAYTPGQAEPKLTEAPVTLERPE